MVENGGTSNRGLLLSVLFLLSSSSSLAYRPGDIVPTSKMGQYHSVRIPIPILENPSFKSPIFFFSFWIVFLIGSLNHRHFFFQSRTVWQDVIGRHCPIFAVNREVRLEFWCFRYQGFFLYCFIIDEFLCLVYRFWFQQLSRWVILVLIRTKCECIFH